MHFALEWFYALCETVQVEIVPLWMQDTDDGQG